MRLNISGPINKTLLQIKQKWSTIIKNGVLGLKIDEKIWATKKCSGAEKLTLKKKTSESPISDSAECN